MFEDVYDGVISALSKSGFLNWEMGELFGNPRYKSPITNVCYDNLTLPNEIKLIKFNYDGVNHLPTYNRHTLNDLKNN